MSTVYRSQEHRFVKNCRRLEEAKQRIDNVIKDGCLYGHDCELQITSDKLGDALNTLRLLGPHKMEPACKRCNKSIEGESFTIAGDCYCMECTCRDCGEVLDGYEEQCCTRCCMQPKESEAD